jgi:hypothetical protein
VTESEWSINEGRDLAPVKSFIVSFGFTGALDHDSKAALTSAIKCLQGFSLEIDESKAHSPLSAISVPQRRNAPAQRLVDIGRN